MFNQDQDENFDCKLSSFQCQLIAIFIKAYQVSFTKEPLITKKFIHLQTKEESREMEKHYSTNLNPTWRMKPQKQVGHYFR